MIENSQCEKFKAELLLMNIHGSLRYSKGERQSFQIIKGRLEKFHFSVSWLCEISYLPSFRNSFLSYVKFLINFLFQIIFNNNFDLSYLNGSATIWSSKYLLQCYNILSSTDFLILNFFVTNFSRNLLERNFAFSIAFLSKGSAK